jgi:prepilin signal peptidase PulO-like enzyme (type II secretory pathway)
MLILLEEGGIFLILAVASIYASFKDIQNYVYPDFVDRFLFTVGFISFIIHQTFFNFSQLVVLKSIVSVSFAGISSAILWKLGAIGDGDGKYLLALSLCYPTYPESLAFYLSQPLGVTPRISVLVPFSMVLMINTLFALAYLLMVYKAIRSTRPKAYFVIYAAVVVLVSILVTPKALLALPLPALLYTIVEKNSKRDKLPLIPCLFAALVISLTLGDLSILFFG